MAKVSTVSEVVAGMYVVLTFIASLSLVLFGRLAFRVKAKVF